MSLSKPFPLQKLPRLAFENVLHQMYPLDLFELSNIPSKNLLNLIKTTSLASHCDIDDTEKKTIAITMRSGYTLTWCILNVDSIDPSDREWFRRRIYHNCFQEGDPRLVVVNDSLKLENYKCPATDTIYSEAFLTGPEPLEVPLFTQLLSKFPCPIETLSLHSKPYELFDKNIFNWKTVNHCAKLSIDCLDEENYFKDVLNIVEVSEKVKVNYSLTFESFLYDTLKNYKELELDCIASFGHELNYTSNHEHLILSNCLEVEDLIQYFKSWQNGAHRQLKTFYYNGPEKLKLVTSTLDFQLSLPKDSPRFVKCAHLYMATTPGSRSKYHTILMKNCHGQLATLCRSADTLLFAVWEEPFTEVKIPAGHRFRFLNGEHHQVFFLLPSYGEVFKTVQEVEKEEKGYASDLQVYIAD